MKNFKIKALRSVVLTLCMALCVCGSAAGDYSAATERYLINEVSEPTPGSVGGEWAMLGFARSGAALPDGFKEGYLARAEEYVKSRGGVLSGNKYTEYSRMIIALTALGEDARSFAGYDLIAPLADVEKTVRQGINGAVYALLALDCGAYGGSEREAYLGEILSRRLDCGGFSLSGDTPDADVTAMALQALAKYTDRAEVAEAVEAALACLAEMQEQNGGFSSGGAENAESCAQVLTALCELGIDINDERFVKNGSTVLDALLAYRTETGGFEHIIGGGVSLMSTEQAYYALADFERVSAGKTSLYDMSDILSGGAANTGGVMELFEQSALFSAYAGVR